VKPRAAAFAVFRHLVLLMGAAIMLAPFVWMLLSSLKPPDEIFSTTLRLLPERWYAIENYTRAFGKVPLARYLVNGFVVTAAIFLLQAMFALPCAYALAKLRFAGRGALFALVMLGLLIPPQVPSIPVYIMLYKVGLLNTYGALILPSSISVFGIYLMRQFFRTVPDELIQAARLDGCSEWTIVWRIMLPSALPALIAFGILSFVWNWNDYFWPLLVITDPELLTPPLGTVYLSNQEAGTDFGPLMAGTAVITAPLVIAFLVAQRRFVQGMTMAGLKF